MYKKGDCAQAQITDTIKSTETLDVRLKRMERIQAQCSVDGRAASYSAKIAKSSPTQSGETASKETPSAGSSRRDPIYCTHHDHQRALGLTSSRWNVGTRSFCVFCNSYVEGAATRFYEESDNEPLLPDLAVGSHDSLPDEQPSVVNPCYLQLVPEVFGSDNTSSDTQEPIDLTCCSPSPTTGRYQDHSSSPNNQTSLSPDLTISSVLSYTPGLQQEASLQSHNTPSRSPTTGSPYRCQFQACNKVFPNNRELQRHCKSRKHAQHLWDDCSTASASSFRCACGKFDTRRDNHERHVKICQNEATGQYRCDKGHTRSDKEEWLAHLQDAECKPRRGRPRTSSRPSMMDE
ncbi:hypothetical protein GGR58DRAFT_527377 [Xylaria digitata]|nr:hypothetical protein GGR58DRAFT_527377 [Xylaria digitata]